MKFDKYTLIAWFFPAILTSFPAVITIFLFSEDSQVKGLLEFIKEINIIKGLTVSLVFLYLYSHLIRITSKIYQKKYFIRKMGFPTTYMLLYSDEKLTSEFKNAFRDKVKQDFNISLPSKTDEKHDFVKVKRIIDEAIKRIIAKYRKNRMIYLHNMWYGFIRNLIGGLPYCIILSICNVIICITRSCSIVIIILSITIVVISIAMYLLKKRILIQYAEEYANQLFTEYMVN